MDSSIRLAREQNSDPRWISYSEGIEVQYVSSDFDILLCNSITAGQNHCFSVPLQVYKAIAGVYHSPSQTK